MGKFLNKFRNAKDKTANVISGVPETLGRYNNQRENRDFVNKRRIIPPKRGQMNHFAVLDEEEKRNKGNFEEEDYDDYDDVNEYWDDDVGIQPAQKPESFHHFILENQYKDLERSIRGLKDVWDAKQNKWITKRKEIHCFTDEEAEEILRTAQSHLATDIKLGFIRAEVFGEYMMAIYKEIAFLFESIAEYRYGRYGSFENQYKMKLQNQKIFLELITRVQANYSRAIGGSENKATHGSVRGQESLQSMERDYTGGGRLLQ